MRTVCANCKAIVEPDERHVVKVLRQLQPEGQGSQTRESVSLTVCRSCSIEAYRSASDALGQRLEEVVE